MCGVHRILDLDLDFFVQPVLLSVPPGSARPDPTKHEVALGCDTALRTIAVETADPVDAAIHYLRERLGLAEPLPGAAVDQHGDLFSIWAQMITCGKLRVPFHLTHVDGHADFGYGQTSFTRVFDVLRRPPAERVAYSMAVLNDGDYLAFAVACGWIHSLTYVYCPGGGSDIDPYFENFGKPNWHCGATGTLRLVALDEETRARAAEPSPPPPVRYCEPRVPFEGVGQAAYSTLDPFDFMFLARSPEFAPVTADPLYDAIRAEYVSAG